MEKIKYTMDENMEPYISPKASKVHLATLEENNTEDEI
jgi:hypothetical protein